MFQLLSLTDIAPVHDKRNRRLKRSLDVVVSLPCLAALLPFYAITALVIRCDSRGPILFRQKRYGLNGKVFHIYKLRTLHAKHAHVTGGQQVIANDNRLTRFGRWLRTYSLDELPQLYNILKGDMSLVGPRPHAIDHHDYYRALIPHFDQRLAVLPGLTGLAQINGLRGPTPDIADMVRRFEMDRAYVRHNSIKGDLKILCQTIWHKHWRS